MPLITKFRNRNELFNEIMITIVTSNVLFYTDWIPSLNESFTFAWIPIFNFLIIIIVNLGIVVYYSIRSY